MSQFQISRRAALLSFGALPVLAAAGCSSAPRAGAFTPTYPRTQALIEEWVAAKRLPSAQISIKTLDAPATLLKAGTAAFDDSQVVDQDTIYRVYSMTKPVTGFATMLLIQDGKLSLDQPLGDVLPAFRDMKVMIGEDITQTRPAARPILIRHLLTHTAGFSYHINGDGALPRAYRAEGLYAAGRSITVREGDGQPVGSLEEFCLKLSQLPLSFEPGATWQYSVALDVLGHVIEKTSGMSFADFLRQRIFGPLRMNDTGFHVPAEKSSRLTSCYWRTQEGPVNIDDRATSAFLQAEGVDYGGSGLVSTLRDYSRFAGMLANGGAFEGARVADRETVLLAHSNLLPEGFNSAASIIRGAEFGAGVGIATAASARPGERPPRSYSWGGAAGTLFWVDPANQIHAVFMTQVMNENDAIWSPLQQAVYADLEAMPDLVRERVDTLSRPRKNY